MKTALMLPKSGKGAGGMKICWHCNREVWGVGCVSSLIPHNEKKKKFFSLFFCCFVLVLSVIHVRRIIKCGATTY